MSPSKPQPEVQAQRRVPPLILSIVILAFVAIFALHPGGPGSGKGSGKATAPVVDR